MTAPLTQEQEAEAREIVARWTAPGQYLPSSAGYDAALFHAELLAAALATVDELRAVVRLERESGGGFAELWARDSAALRAEVARLRAIIGAAEDGPRVAESIQDAVAALDAAREGTP